MANICRTETTEKENRRKERLGHRRRKQENQHGPREEPEGWSSDDSEYVTHAYDNYQQERGKDEYFLNQLAFCRRYFALGARTF